MTDTTKRLPESEAAQAALLGAIILNPALLEKAFEFGIRSAMFDLPHYRAVFDAIVEVERRSGSVDELLVVNHLETQNAFDGRLNLTRSDVYALAERCPAVANAKAYMAEVRDIAILRSLIRRGEQIAALGYERPDLPEVLVDQACAIMDAMHERTSVVAEAPISTMADHMLAFYDQMAERAERGTAIAGMSTGLSALDERWGGLQGGRLYVVAGRPGMGKTALGMGLAESIVFGHGEDVLSFNFEMSLEEQGGRAIARAGSLNLHRLANTIPSDEEFQASYETIQRLHEAAKRFHTDESASLTAGEIVRRSRKKDRELRKEGRRLSAVIVDYLGKIRAPRGMSQYDSVTYSSAELKSLALELGIPVIVLAQLNRSVEQRDSKRPNLGDLRDSGAIEQDADIVALLFRPEYYAKDDTPPEWRGVALIETAKARVGRVGEDKARWEGEHVRFSDYRDVYQAGMSRRAA